MAFTKCTIELNDEERGIVRIKYNPWLKVSIPKSDSTVQRAISAEACVGNSSIAPYRKPK